MIDYQGLREKLTLQKDGEGILLESPWSKLSRTDRRQLRKAVKEFLKNQHRRAIGSPVISKDGRVYTKALYHYNYDEPPSRHDPFVRIPAMFGFIIESDEIPSGKSSGYAGYVWRGKNAIGIIHPIKSGEKQTSVLRFCEPSDKYISPKKSPSSTPLTYRYTSALKNLLGSSPPTCYFNNKMLAEGFLKYLQKRTYDL